MKPKEVICVREFGRLAILTGFPHTGYLNGPVKNEPYIVDEVVIEPDGAFYLLREFDKKIGFMRPMFDSVHFADVTSLQTEIDEALKAPTPKRKRLVVSSTPTGSPFYEHALDALGYYLPGYPCRHNWKKP